MPINSLCLNNGVGYGILVIERHFNHMYICAWNFSFRFFPTFFITTSRKR